MIGMFEQMLLEMARRQDDERMRTHGGMLEGESVFAPRKGVGPRPFRDPEQAGPSPPPREQLSMMMRGQ